MNWLKDFGSVGLVSLFIFSLYFVFVQPTIASEPDLSGTWTGSTECPLGHVSFKVEIKGKTGTFKHSGFDAKNPKPEDLPATVRFMPDPDKRALLDITDRREVYEGALSRDGSTLHMRGMGACKDYVLTRMGGSRKQVGSGINTEGDTDENCGPTPQDYRQRQYGDVLYFLEKPCYRILSSKEQIFVAGVSQYFHEHCGFPSDIPSRLKLQKFLLSSTLVASGGTQFGNEAREKAIGDQLSSEVSYGAGYKAAKSIGCTEIGKQFATHIVEYLDRTAETSSSYVNGCIVYHSGRYTKQQCQCLADIGRSVIPDIHQTLFSDSSVEKIWKSNPFVGLQVLAQCKISMH